MSTLHLVNQQTSTVDKTQKLTYTLLHGATSSTIEVSAIDKGDGKVILCVPTQTACAQACRFCHTTLMAGRVAVEDLTSEQIKLITRTAWLDAFDEYQRTQPLLVSFMGVGEPMANVGNLLDAINLLEGWATERLTSIRFAVSTMMPRKHLHDFSEFMAIVARMRFKVKLHLSLHYTLDEERQHWMPAASAIAVSLSLLQVYAQRTGNPTEIHYTLIPGVNDSLTDAYRLRVLLSEAKTPVKFLKYNPVPGDANTAPSDIAVASFRSILEDGGIHTEWYDSPGADIMAACGMFAADSYIPSRSEGTLISIDTTNGGWVSPGDINCPDQVLDKSTEQQAGRRISL